MLSGFRQLPSQNVARITKLISGEPQQLSRHLTLADPRDRMEGRREARERGEEVEERELLLLLLFPVVATDLVLYCVEIVPA